MTQTPVVALDTACIQCGYNVRGLPETGSCPECGAPVADSLKGDRLQHASPVYVTRLVRGARLVWWSIVVMLLGIIAMFAVGALASTGVGLGRIPRVFLPATLLASSIMAMIGWWLLSMPDPSAEVHAERASTARVALRFALIVMVVGTLLEGFAGLLVLPGLPAPGTPTTQDALAMLALAAAAVRTIASLVYAVASILYVRHLARRIPDRALESRTRTILITAGVFIGVVVILGLIGMLLPGPAGLVFGCGFAIGILVMLVMYFGMIERLRSSLVAVRAAQVGGTM